MEARATTWERLRRVDPRIWDAAVAAVVLLILEATLWLERNATTAGNGAGPIAAVLLVVASLALYWRRTRPLAVILVVSAAGAVFALLQERPTQPALELPLVLAVYACGAYLPRSR